jgi:hypothetical protein
LRRYSFRKHLGLPWAISASTLAWVRGVDSGEEGAWGKGGAWLIRSSKT